MSNPYAWCAERNAQLARDDIEWVVGPGGKPILTDCRAWSDANRKADAERVEDERKRFNWRTEHPLEQREIL